MLGERVNPLRGAPVQLLKHPGLRISRDSAKQSETILCQGFFFFPGLMRFISEVWR